jgi:metal-responsive CopG/Arc/MetJ family transcriptional regulator
MAGKRTHVVIPETLVRAIDALVGKRGRSVFIAEAAARELERRQLLEALGQASGAWKDINHPELKDGAAAHIAAQRHEDEKRDEDRRGKLSR